MTINKFIFFFFQKEKRRRRRESLYKYGDYKVDTMKQRDNTKE